MQYCISAQESIGERKNAVEVQNRRIAVTTTEAGKKDRRTKHGIINETMSDRDDDDDVRMHAHTLAHIRYMIPINCGMKAFGILYTSAHTPLAEGGRER